jgi:hypothetical protein
MATFQRRYTQHVSPAAVAAFLLDPMFAQKVGQGWTLAFSSFQDRDDLRDRALQVVIRITGADPQAAKKEWNALTLQDQFPAKPAKHLDYLTEKTTSSDGKTNAVPAAQRRGWWSRVAFEKYPIMAQAAQRLLSAHATTAAAERNWSAWGRVYSSTRSRMRIKTAEKLIYIKCNMDTSARSLDYRVSMDYLDGMTSDSEDDEDK